MSFLKHPRFRISAVILSTLIIVLLIVFVQYCKKKEGYETTASKKNLHGFTFFEIGENTQFSNDVREELREKLGSDAIETWNTLDLSINYKGFLQSYFPELYELNKKLNSPVGERIEHDTIKLTYRYAQTQNVPFGYVELVFSNIDKKPLLFYIKSKNEGSDIVDVVTQKYGKPTSIRWDKKDGQSIYWKKNRSVLIISIMDDRYGNPEYHTNIYFVESLEKLLFREQTKRQHKEDRIKTTGKTAF
jgi:hypothetical protein